MEDLKDGLYAINDEKLHQVRTSKPWMADPKHFKRVKISPSAAIKMMMHGQSGVDKGVKQNGKPVEVMGMLVGRPDTEDPHSVIISDAQALPIEGFETRVVADDEGVINYMISLGDINELSRKDGFCGWYHTHPFDVDVHSHCYLSNTDISTQLQWQRAEDPHGNPWFAIVIDPLRSLQKNTPDFKAFRVYPPDYSPPPNQTPDGKIEAVDRIRVERWGSCWNRYYELETSYFMSHLAHTTLDVMKGNFLWQGPLTSSSLLDPEQQEKIAEQTADVADKLAMIARSGAGDGGISLSSSSTSSSSSDPDPTSSALSQAAAMAIGTSRSTLALGKVCQLVEEVSTEHCRGCVNQLSKRLLFQSYQRAKELKAKARGRDSSGGDVPMDIA